MSMRGGLAETEISDVMRTAVLGYARGNARLETAIIEHVVRGRGLAEVAREMTMDASDLRRRAKRFRTFLRGAIARGRLAPEALVQ